VAHPQRRSTALRLYRGGMNVLMTTSAGWRPRLAAAAAALLTLHLAAAQAPPTSDAPAGGSEPMPWLSQGLRWPAAAASDSDDAVHELRWQRRNESSQWLARVALAPLPTPSLHGEAQWSARWDDVHAVRLGVQAQQALGPGSMQTASAAAYLQQEIALARDWGAAFGVHADGAVAAEHSLVSPRAALSWQPQPGLQLRWSAGVVAAEAALSAPAWDAPAPTLSVHDGGLRVHASELALHWQLGTAQRLRARWATLDADEDAADGVQRLLAAVQAQASLPWRGATAGLEWLRLQGRGPESGWTQTLVNATVAWTPAGTPWTLAANAYNLVDPALPEGVAAPDLLLREGRRWQLQLTRQF
jgi:hypothetical protein